MKNLFKNLMLVAVAAMAFTACTENNEEVNAVNEKVTLTFVAGFGEDTRVSLDNTDNDKVYKAAWEEGDTVTFAVFEDADATAPKEVSDAFMVNAAAETVEFTVTFTNGLEAGNVIKAYVNYVVTNDYWFDVQKGEWDQYPSNDGPSMIHASASVVYAEGVDYATLSFEHDYAYGLMTIESLPFSTAYFEVIIDDNSFYVNTNESKGYTGEKLWFYCAEDLDVKEFKVVAYSDDYTQSSTFVRTFAGEGEFAFKKGRVSRFTVSSWKSQLAMPVVNTAVSGLDITLSWAPVEGADYYRVVSEAYSDELVDKTLAKNETSYVFHALKPDTDYSFYVYACANDDNETYVTSNGKYVWISSGNTTPVVNISTPILNFGVAADSKEVTITSAFTTSPVTVSEECEWLSVELVGETLTVSVSENTGAERSADITVSAGGVEDQKITVNQDPVGKVEADGSIDNPYVFTKVELVYGGFGWAFSGLSNSTDVITLDCNTAYLDTWIGDHGDSTWILLSKLLYNSGSSIYQHNDTSYLNGQFWGSSYVMVTKLATNTYTLLFHMSADGGITKTYYTFTGVLNASM